MTAAVSFDVRQIPFATRGSWFDLSPVVGLHTTADDLHLVSHVGGMHAVLALQPVREGRPVATEWLATQAELVWRAADGAEVRAAFDGPSAVRLRGSGLALRLGDASAGLTPFTGTYLFEDPVDGALVFTSYETGRRYRVTTLAGTVRAEGAEALGRAERAVLAGADGRPWEVVVEETTTAAPAYRSELSFDQVVARTRRAFDEYADAIAPWRTDAVPAAALAAYVLWSATVAPAGELSRESVLMSKHWMDKVWSWDHCFTALALAEGLPDLAIDQFLVPFDHQDAAGALPDSVTHSEVLYNYVKPPIHGWALTRLRESLGRPLERAELTRIHDHLARWTRFWLDHRRRPGHPLPYYQHGNDSGWDNATTFDLDRVVESPDLAAFLVLQLEVLADLATELDLPGEQWTAERDRVLRALLSELWTGASFTAVGALSGRPSTTSSLLLVLPLVLGDRLPGPVRDRLVERLAEHLTDHGPATEPVTSPHHESDGYWRGPIWAPSTALVVDGLQACGYAELAATVSARFRRLCERSGFAENFDARTGAGLRDRAYTWTAAVYLWLAARAVDGAVDGR